MKTFYSKNFAKYSPFFPILMIVILVYGYLLRADIILPTTVSQNQISLWGKFGFSYNFIVANIRVFYNIEFWVSLLSVIAAFFLGMSLIGKTSGLFIATFLGIYPFYVANTYSAQTITLFFFMLYLLFQLQATVHYSRVFSVLAGSFFMLSFICNPICLLLGLVMYIYQAICARNIAVLFNFLLFVGSALVIYIIYTIFISRFPANIVYMPSITDTFSEFGKNFSVFVSAPINYIKNIILPLFTDTLAYPKLYSAKLNAFNYWHYLAIFSSIFGLLYSFVEERARIISIIGIIVLLQAFFMTMDFGFLFFFVILIGSYLIDKVFNDVFC